MRSLGRAPPNLVHPPWAATGEFLAENLDLATPPPIGNRMGILGKDPRQCKGETAIDKMEA